MIKILFVCTGNICRSPTAEGVFRHLAAKAGLDGAFRVDSAGVSSGHVGEPPDSRSVEVAKRNGISIEKQRARNLLPADFNSFDYIFAMDSGHMRAMQSRQACGTAARLRMFLEKGDVPDPWYGDMDGFESVYTLIHGGAEKILRQLRLDHNL